MRGNNTWSYKPYHPLLYGGEKIYISRIAPYVDSVKIDWFDETGYEDEFTVYYKKIDDENYTSFTVENNTAEITGLEELCDYEFYITNARNKSKVRLFRTGDIPGKVVNYLHPNDKYYKFSGQYLCSPSLVKLNDGSLLASMDVFEGNAPQNLTLIFKSTDNGETWSYLTELFPCFWGKLFVHRDAVYMLSMSTEYGDLLIGKSIDGGETFTLPTVIARGSCSNKAAGFHKAPMPVIEFNGRLWTAVDYGAWNIGGHSSSMLSIDVNDDLLCAENWTYTYPVPYDSAWTGAVKGNSAGCLEGNAVVTPDGDIVNMLRYQTNGCEPSYGKSVLLKVVDVDSPLTLHKIIDFQGNLSKFDVVYDEVSKHYVSIVTGNEQNQGRNILSFAASSNFYDWKTICTLIDYTNDDPKKIGFQYISLIIDGDDILYLSRTAFNEARNFHDANYSTFHKISDFRKML
jgi:hypothetical protein